MNAQKQAPLTPLPAHRESCRHFRLDNADLVIDGPPAYGSGLSVPHIRQKTADVGNLPIP